MNHIKPLLLIIVLSIFSCKKKDDNAGQPQLKEVPVITGILTRDINAQPTSTMGIPNTNTGSANDYNRILAYPNPCTSAFTLVINSADTATAHIWMVKGDYQEGNTNAEEYIWAEQNSIPLDVYQSLEAGSNNILYNVADVPNGYYRLYVEFNSVKLWDNIWVNRP